MDIEIEIGGYAFEWDDKKAEQVLRQHGVDFQDAARLWSEDPALMEAQAGREKHHFDREAELPSPSTPARN